MGRSHHMLIGSGAFPDLPHTPLLSPHTAFFSQLGKTPFFSFNVRKQKKNLTTTTYLSSVGAGNGLGDLGDLGASTDDALTGRVVDVGDVLVLELSTLPDLDLAAAAEDTDTHSGQQVVGGVGVVVDTTVEDGRGVLADGRGNQGLATGVIADKVADIVDNTSNGHEGLSVLGVSDEVIPVNDGELLKGSTPVEGGALLVELLLELLDTALFDLVGAELLEVVGQASPLPQDNHPLGRVVLPPLNGVSVIGRELVVEVVVALTEGDERGDDVVTG